MVNRWDQNLEIRRVVDTLTFFADYPTLYKYGIFSVTPVAQNVNELAALQYAFPHATFIVNPTGDEEGGLHEEIIYTQVTSKVGFGQRESSRDRTILSRSILLILSDLRSFDPGALAQPKFQLLRLLGYNQSRDYNNYFIL